MRLVKSNEDSFVLLDDFISNNIHNYSNKRNFDFGPKDRSNVSQMSPYISHRILTEYDVVKRVLQKKLYRNVEKYIQEVFWRLYWRGWLESRPRVWDDFMGDLKFLEKNKLYYEAIEGLTDIECFNYWVKELRENGFLHNHTRMWFASIWIFTLNLPWQLGAEFFLKYLTDADSASNTLSWRWVAGIQTKGKNYLAKNWNIEKFTNGKFSPAILNENALPVSDSRNYTFSKINYSGLETESETIVMFENELNTDFLDNSNYKHAYFCLLSNDERQVEISQKNMIYKESVVDNLTKEASCNMKKINGSQLISLVQSNDNVHLVYPGAGDNLDFINKNLMPNANSFIRRKEDIFCYQFSNKGFFNFKKNIPRIISELNLSK